MKDFASRSFTYYTANVATSGIATPFGASENLNTLYGSAESAESGMVKTESIGAGCSSCGTGTSGTTKTYFFMEIAQGATLDQNEVTRVVVEDTQDSAGTAVYRKVYGLNSTGQALREGFIQNSTAATPTFWCESWKLATTGKKYKLGEHRLPSAHAVTTSANFRTFLDPYDSEATAGERQRDHPRQRRPGERVRVQLRRHQDC